MSILGGIFSRRLDTRPDPSWAHAFRSAISRNPSDSIQSYEDQSVCLFKIDAGAYGSPAFRQGPSGSVSMLIGEPLLSHSESGAGTSRARDLEILHHALDKGNWDILKNSQGSFAGIYYGSSSRALHLFADKLGLRPLYYWMNEDWFVYASALRILECLYFVPKVMDVRAVTEISSFAFPLGPRTAYDHIKTIKAAEVVSVESQKHSSQQYWRWDTIPVSSRPEADLLFEVYNRFNIAVRRRVQDDRSPLAFLSGGLDSRCLVASLVAQTGTVHTLNFGLSRTQDRVYGAEMARRFGTFHHEEEMMISNPGFFHRVLEVALTLADAKSSPVRRPLLVWSGDGGSVGLGHVYITSKIIDLLRKQDLQGAITQFLLGERKQIVARLLQPRARKSLSETLRQGMREEFSDIHCEDPGRNLYVFLLLNDQRRHLAVLSEGVDLNRFDFVTPFFDGDFLSAVASVPMDLCLMHRFYNKWLSYFPPSVLSVPWQVYPSHEPGPVQSLPGLVSQFDRSEHDYLHSQKRLQLLRDTAALLKSDAFPDSILSHRNLRFAHMAYRWGIRDYSYVLDAALVYSRYWKLSQGKSAPLDCFG